MRKEPDTYTGNSLKVRLYPTAPPDVMNVNNVNFVLIADPTHSSELFSQQSCSVFKLIDPLILS